MKLSVKKIGFLSLCFSLLAGPLAHAEVLTIQSVTGASLYVPGTASSGGSAATTPTIFAGLVADGTLNGVMTGECAAPPSNESTCNSCDGSGLKPCNPTSIHGNLNLRIRLKSDSDIFTNAPALRYTFGGTTMEIPPGTLPVLRRSEAFDFVVDWNTLCSKYPSGTGSCLTDLTSVTLTVGIINGAESTFKEKVDIVVNLRYIDSSVTTYDAYSPCPDGVAPTSGTQGICDFTVFPGDEKIYILSFYSSSTTLATPHSAVKYNRMVMFYAPTLATVNNLSTNYTLNLTVNATGSSDEEPSLDSNKITGLINDSQRYCFALGNQDQAGNISYFTPAAELVDANARKYCATPSDVVGLLNDKKCFIATATFGSEMAPEVNTFRAFRNQFLMTNSAGRSFVKAYYKFGPVAAQWISDSPFLKSLSLILLWPLLLFVKISLALGLMPALLVSLLTALVLLKSAHMILQRRSTAGEA